MVRQHVTAGARNIEKTKLTSEESAYRRFVGRAQYSPAGSTALRDLIPLL
jgi:hypothetical protein